MLGGYGNFGARICRALAADSNLKLVVAARDGARAHAFAQSLSSHVTAASIDVHSTDLSGQLSRLDAGLVIHTAGPFQGQDWRVPDAVARAGAHYIDLADGRRWVAIFRQRLIARFSNKIHWVSVAPALCLLYPQLS